MTEAPPIYLALDLWQALDLPVRQFDAYYERNGWAETWSSLLAEVRWRSGRKTCPIIVDGQPCVLVDKHIGPHMDASDVGSSEPLPIHGNGSTG